MEERTSIFPLRKRLPIIENGKEAQIPPWVTAIRVHQHNVPPTWVQYVLLLDDGLTVNDFLRDVAGLPTPPVGNGSLNVSPQENLPPTIDPGSSASNDKPR
jgi:hypothetical protein